jgi:hypothetical protein
MSLRVSDDNEARPYHERFTTAAHHAVDAAISRLDELRRRHSAVTVEVVLRALIQNEFCGRLAVVSSFGAESAVLLALIAEIDRGVPILFLDTGKLFGETLRYRDRLIAALGLTDVRTLHPRSEHLATGDADGMLWLNVFGDYIRHHLNEEFRRGGSRRTPRANPRRGPRFTHFQRQHRSRSRSETTVGGGSRGAGGRQLPARAACNRRSQLLRL